MDKKAIDELFVRIGAGSATEEEVALFNRWYQQYEAGLQVYTEADLERIRQDMGLKLPVLCLQEKKTRFWPRIAGVAAAVTAIIFGIWFYKALHHANTPRHAEFISASQDIAPGRNMATLTLANGKVITLSDAKTGVVVGVSSLKYNDGSTVDSLAPLGRGAEGGEGNRNNSSLPKRWNSPPGGEKSMMLTATTPRGGTYQIILPDGSRVWLNAASRLKFPSTFSGAVSRKVELSGEAYFEILKDKKHPFIVQTDNQKIEVLGTHFNVNAYADEPSSITTLIEGQVKVVNNDSGREDFLRPGEQSVVQLASTRINKAEEEEALDWVNNKIIFNDEPLAAIMRKVARWYNVEVTFRDGTEKLIFMGAVSRNKKISSVLNYFKSTETVDFILKNNRIIVIKKY